MDESASVVRVDPRDEWFIPVGDPRRQLGALVDLVVSVALLVGIVSLGMLAESAGAVALFPLTVPLFFALDIAIYTVPLSRWGWSIGNLLTGRRVIDRTTGGRLTVRASMRRYGARRLAGLVLRDQVRRGLRLGESGAPGPTVSSADLASGSTVISSTTPVSVLQPASAPTTAPAMWLPPIPN